MLPNLISETISRITQSYHTHRLSAVLSIWRLLSSVQKDGSIFLSCRVVVTAMCSHLPIDTFLGSSELGWGEPYALKQNKELPMSVSM